MILFFQSGRLGNQLFQYAALRTIAADETLVLVGFDELQSAFDGLRARFVGKAGSRFFRACEWLRPRLNRLVPRTRLLSFVEELPASGPGAFRVSRGMFGSLKYAGTGYFQCEAAFDPAVVAGLRIRPHLVGEASALLEPVRRDGAQPVFVHVRRGDYLHFPSTRYPAVLPASWYLDRISEFRNLVENPRFVLLSDDVHYLHDVFGDLHDACIPDVGPEAAFAIMSQCNGGILSASSFAWWGAYFAHRANAAGHFVGPAGWVGHRAGEWHPPHIESTFLSYVKTRRAR